MPTANATTSTADDKQEQQKQKNTEKRMAASIFDEVQRLNEELAELAIRENKLREDPQQKAQCEAKAKELEDEIENLKRVHAHRSRSHWQRAANSVCSFIGRDDPLCGLPLHSMHGKNSNDQFRLGEHDEARIFHRNDAGETIGCSLLDLPKGPERSLQVMQSHREDWDEMAKIDPGKTLRFATNNPTAKYYLKIFLAAKHDRSLNVNSDRSDRLAYWLRNTSISLITRRKILKQEETREIRACCSAYNNLLEDIETNKTLTDQQKTTFKDQLRTGVNQVFNANLGAQDDPKGWLLLGLNNEQLNGYQLEQQQQYKEQLQDSRITKVFADCFDLIHNPPQPAARVSAGRSAGAVV